MSQVLLGLAIAAGIFAYIAKNTETVDQQDKFDPRQAVVQYSNMFLSYITLLILFFYTIQEMNYSNIPSEILTAQTQIYILMVLIIFIFQFWSYLTTLKKENIEIA